MTLSGGISRVHPVDARTTEDGSLVIVIGDPDNPEAVLELVPNQDGGGYSLSTTDPQIADICAILSRMEKAQYELKEFLEGILT